jgi:hypothetical protein
VPVQSTPAPQKFKKTSLANASSACLKAKRLLREALLRHRA